MFQSEISKEVLVSKRLLRTTNELRQFVLKICHDALTQHYGHNYSNRCFQSSIIIKDILDTLGINSVIVLGATCFPRVIGEQPYQLSWNGFWGKDHHIWLMTEFYEIVDLTISQLHLHQLNINLKAHAIPPLWWYPGDEMPSMFKYLPSGKAPMLEDESKEDLQRLRIVTEQILANDVDSTDFSPILHGIESMNQLFENGDHWAIGVLALQEMNTQLPEWILNREKELFNQRYR
jgi:hypothetical protein